MSGKERRFAKDVNHRLSKRLVTKAQDTNRAIAVESLTGIRERVTVRKSQRAALHSWSLYQLKSFITDRATLAGIPVTLVDPRNTSRTCPACSWVDKRHRPSQDTFSCIQYGFAGLADYTRQVISPAGPLPTGHTSLRRALGRFQRQGQATG